MVFDQDEYKKILDEFVFACKSDDQAEINKAAEKIGKHRGGNYGPDFITRSEMAFENILTWVLTTFEPRRNI